VSNKEAQKNSEESLHLATRILELKHCTSSHVKGLLESLVGSDSEAVAFASALLVSTAATSRTRPEWLQTAFEVFGRSESQLANSFLKHAALNAQNAEIRLHAVRELKHKKLDGDMRQLLHDWLSGEIEGSPVAFQRQIQVEEFQRAALEALSRKGVRSHSVAAVWELLKQLLSSRDASTEVYSGTLDCLTAMTRPSLIHKILSEVGKQHSGKTNLDLLSICGNMEPNQLKGTKTKLREALRQSLGVWSRGEEIRDGVANLAAKLVSSDFLISLTELPDVTLRTHRGKVVAAVMDAYSSADDALCNASLNLAKNVSNANASSACVKALSRCAASRGEMILRRICLSESEGIRQLRDPQCISEIFGSLDNIAETGSKAITNAAPDDGRKMAPIVTALILACSIPPKVEDRRKTVQLNSFARQLVADDALVTEDTRQRYVEISQELNLEHVLKDLVRTATSPKSPKELAYLLEPLLCSSDKLGIAIVRIVLEVAQEFCISKRDSNRLSSAYGQVESWLGKFDAQVVEALVHQGLFVNGVLSLYLLGVARRLKLNFYNCATALINSDLSIKPKLAVINQIEQAGGEESLQVLCEAGRFVSGNDYDVRIRAAAIESIGKLCDCSLEEGMTPSDDCLQSIHERISHGSERERRKAYGACSRMADQRSIKALKDREQTEKDGKALARLKQALAAIRERLEQERPEYNSTDPTREWLKHASNLGDPQLLPQVEKYLIPPHPEELVQLAAIEFLKSCRSPEGVQVLDRYIKDTSPHGMLLQAARGCMSTLKNRQDVKLLDVLTWLFGESSDMVDPEQLNYEELFGAQRCGVLAGVLGVCREEYGAENWDNFATVADNVGQCIVRHIYTSYHREMGISEEEGKKFAERSYHNQLNFGKFVKTFPMPKKRFQTIHECRQEAKTAHPEDVDGTPKPGIQGKNAADAILTWLGEAFEWTAQALQQARTPS